MAVLWSLQKAAESVGCMSRQKAGLDTLLPPFAVMAGSGLTSLQARQLCALAEQHLPLRLGLSLPDLPTTFPARYLQVFSLFPSGWHLREFLEIHLKDREPSPACRELARLVGPNGLTSLILTVNFCDEIPDAVRERDLKPWVLDHPDEIRQRLVLSLPQLQIIKLHGDYRHFDSCNLEAELKRRARQVRDKVLDVLSERTMLVFGYSGWKGDAFLSALRHHLTRRTTFPGSIWWFCYSDDDCQRLPGWLVNSPYVRMVTPSASNRSFLDAGEVLASLRTEMERFREATPVTVPVPVPARFLVTGGCGFISTRTSSALLERSWEKWFAIESQDRALREAYFVTHESNPTLALSLAKERQRLMGTPVAIDYSVSSVCALEARYGEAYCLRRLGRSEEALEQFRFVAEQASFDEPLLRGRYAHARNGEGVTLADLGRHDEAVSVWSHVVELPDREDPQVRQARDFALNNLWLTQWRLGLAGEMRTFARLLRQLSASNDPLVLSLLGRAVEIRLPELREEKTARRQHVSDDELMKIYDDFYKTSALRNGDFNVKEGNFNVFNVKEGDVAPVLVNGYPLAAGLLRAAGKRAKFNVFKEVIKALERQLLIGVPDGKIEPTFKEEGDGAHRPGRAEEAVVRHNLLCQAVEVLLAELHDEEKMHVKFKENFKGIRIPDVCLPAVGDTLVNRAGYRLTSPASTATSTRTRSLSSNHCRGRLSSQTHMASAHSRSTAQMPARAAA